MGLAPFFSGGIINGRLNSYFVGTFAWVNRFLMFQGQLNKLFTEVVLTCGLVGPGVNKVFFIWPFPCGMSTC